MVQEDTADRAARWEAALADSTQKRLLKRAASFAFSLMLIWHSAIGRHWLPKREGAHSVGRTVSGRMPYQHYTFFGLICGKKRTSWIVGELVMNIVRRSIPIPSPDVGGIPYSRARTKSISINIASSSPLSFSLS